MNFKEYKITENEHGLRFDRVVKSILHKSGAPSQEAFVDAAITGGMVLLAGQAAKPQKRVLFKQKVTFSGHFEAFQREYEDSKSVAYAGEQPFVIAEEKNFFIVSKPFGMLTHSFIGSTGQATLEDWLIVQKMSRSSLERAGIVHRLDRNTSGALIIARTPSAQKALKKLFEERTIEKTYVALSEGNLKELSGTINKPLIRKKGSFKRVIAKNEQESGAKKAETDYRVIARGSECDLLLLTPKTGRTHQIRAHMKSIQHPIAGDLLYGAKKNLCSRQFLHAFSLSFSLGRKKYSFQSPLAPDLIETLKRLDAKAFLRYDDEAFEEIFSC